MNKKYLLYALVSVIAFTAVSGVVLADSVTNRTNPMNNLVNAIAQKFNLNVSDVQAVFDDQRTNVQANMQQRFVDEIKQAVTNGKLTQAQADLIIAKKAEVDAQRASLQKDTSKNREEIVAEMKTQQDALKQWAKDNNIPEQYLRFCGKGMPGRGGHGGMGEGWFNKNKPAN